MLHLNLEKNISIYGFVSEGTFEKAKVFFEDKKVFLFEGTKEELLKKDNDFWYNLVEEKTHGYRDYLYPDTVNTFPKFSGYSAINSVEGKFFIIVKEKV